MDTLTGLYERLHGLSFGSPDPGLGQARVATGADGRLVGIRKPLATHEQPIMRTYLAVEDIQQAVKKAEEHGATVAFPPARQGQPGTFAIVIQGHVQHGSGNADFMPTCGVEAPAPRLPTRRRLVMPAVRVISTWAKIKRI